MNEDCVVLSCSRPAESQVRDTEFDREYPMCAQHAYDRTERYGNLEVIEQ